MSVTDRMLSALTTVIRMNDKVEEMAGLMKEQQRRLDDLQGRVIRLETVLELALHRSSGTSGRRLETDGSLTDSLVSPTPKVRSALEGFPPEPPGSPARTNRSAACCQPGPKSTKPRTSCSPNLRLQPPFASQRPQLCGAAGGADAPDPAMPLS